MPRRGSKGRDRVYFRAQYGTRVPKWGVACRVYRRQAAAMLEKDLATGQVRVLYTY